MQVPVYPAGERNVSGPPRLLAFVSAGLCHCQVQVTAEIVTGQLLKWVEKILLALQETRWEPLVGTALPFRLVLLCLEKAAGHRGNHICSAACLANCGSTHS